MAPIPMKGDPPTLNDIVALHGDPRDKIAEIHEQLQQGLADAEARGNEVEAKELHKLLKTTQKMIDDYGIGRA